MTDRDLCSSTKKQSTNPSAGAGPHPLAISLAEPQQVTAET